MTTTDNREPTLLRAPNALYRTCSGFLALARPGAPHLAVQGAGAAIWEALASPMTEHSLVQHLAESYGVSREVVVNDVHQLVTTLTEAGYVTANR